MERILNSSNNDGLRIRRFANTVNFKIGQNIYGRILSVSENKEAIIRLLNGLELQANIEGLIGEFENILMNFKIEGLKDGKLQLQLLKNINKENSGKAEVELLKYLMSEGATEADLSIAKNMLEYNIPLTKDNISETKSLIDFYNKINENPEEGKSFIDKYLSSKDIPLNSEKGQNIANKLQEFFNNFKTLDSKNIMLFLENNIDFTSENINSFKNIFEGDSSIFNIVKNLEVFQKNDNYIMPKNIDTEVSLSDKVNLKNTANVDGNFDFNNDILNKDTLTKQDLNKDIFNKETFNKEALPKDIQGFFKDKEQIAKELSNILRENKFSINSRSQEVLYNLINKAVEKVIEENVQGKGQISLQNSPDEGLIKDIVVTNGGAENKLDKSQGNLGETTFKERIFTKENLQDKLSEIIGKPIKVSDSSFRSLSEMLVLNENSYVKEAMDEVIRSSIKDSINNLNSNLKDEALLLNKDSLKEVIITRESEVKEIIKNLITTLSSALDREGAESTALMQLLKGSINDVKLYNKFAENYYYLNVPLNIKEKEYPCKLIIKDDRKSGKNIDSKNLKLALNINTNTFGDISSFVKVNNRNMNIEIKCEKSFIKVFELSKHLLKEKIQNLEFNVNITVTTSKEEFNLNSCRGFFGDNNVAGIDITV